MMNLLPIGSVVTLKEGTKKLMIYGRVQFNSDTDTAYDYLGCFYPEGNIGEEYNFLFNHDDIETVHFIGFVDAEEQAYLHEINDFLEKNAE